MAENGFARFCLAVVFMQSLAMVCLGMWVASTKNAIIIDETSCVAERDKFVEYLDGSLAMANIVAESWKMRLANCLEVDASEIATW